MTKRSHSPSTDTSLPVVGTTTPTKKRIKSDTAIKKDPTESAATASAVDDDDNDNNNHPPLPTHLTSSPSKASKWTPEDKVLLMDAYFEITMQGMKGNWEELARKTGKTVKQCQDQFNAKRPGVRAEVIKSLGLGGKAK